MSVLADQSTKLTTPESLIGQGVVITPYIVHVEEVAHAACRRGCVIASNNSYPILGRVDRNAYIVTILTLVSVYGCISID